jgi:hypothetical protein
MTSRPGEARLAAAEFAHQPAVGLGLFQCRQIGALQILDQRDLENPGIAEVADNDRDLVQPDALRRAPAPFAGDQFVFGVAVPFGPLYRAHQQRLHDALAANQLRQPLQFVVDEMTARLERRGSDRLDWHGADTARPRDA